MSRTGSPVRRNLSGTRTDTQSSQLLRKYSSQSQGHNRRDLARARITECFPTTHPISPPRLSGPSNSPTTPVLEDNFNAPQTPPFIMDEKVIKEYPKKA